MSEKISLPIAADQAGPGDQSVPRTRAQGGDVMSEIESEVKGQKIFLYMKGTPDFPMCGFSARVVQILQHLGAEFGSCDVLADGEKREAIKVYGKWPTIPQLYVDGELVGGCDITTEMFQSGELQSLLGLSK